MNDEDKIRAVKIIALAVVAVALIIMVGDVTKEALESRVVEALVSRAQAAPNTGQLIIGSTGGSTWTEETVSSYDTSSTIEQSSASLEWSVVDGPNNHACTAVCWDKCNAPASFGFDVDAGSVVVGPHDPAADICVCDGAHMPSIEGARLQ